MPSMKPESVEPSFAMLMKISPGALSCVHAYSDVAFVTTCRELVRNGFPFIGEFAALGACEQVLLFRRIGGEWLLLLFFPLDNGSG
jgi:hypothetical protein